MTYPIGNWCEAYTGSELVARAAGVTASVRLDYPGVPCDELQGVTCFDQDGQPMECLNGRRQVGGGSFSSGAGTMDLLPKCNPQHIRVGVDTKAEGLAIPGYAPPAVQTLAEGTSFALTWATPERPLDCEFQSAVTLTIRDAAGEVLDIESNDENHGFLVRFRRATLPADVDGQSREQSIHIPNTGGRGDHSTETTIVTYSEGARFMWRNWCGEDRSPVTLEVVSATGRLTTTLERPSCIDPDARRGSTLGSFE